MSVGPTLRITRGLETDSLDYHVLANAATAIKGLQGTVCEIGTRRGGSMKVIVDALLHNGDFSRDVLCIDPYGNIDYAPGELEPRQSMKCDYTNDMRNEAYSAIYDYAQGKPVNIVVVNLEDTEFFNRFSDGYPFYNEYKHISNTYSLVFFDGPHTVPAIIAEMEFFHSRSPVGAMWVFDDLEYYPHIHVHAWLLDHFWEPVEKTARKAAYRKAAPPTIGG